jgi:hypothetical protein
MVFKELTNKNYKVRQCTLQFMKPYACQQKVHYNFRLHWRILQFGSGDELSEDVVKQPQNVAMNIFGKSYVTDTTFDPSRLDK